MFDKIHNYILLLSDGTIIARGIRNVPQNHFGQRQRFDFGQKGQIWLQRPIRTVQIDCQFDWIRFELHELVHPISSFGLEFYVPDCLVLLYFDHQRIHSEGQRVQNQGKNSFQFAKKMINVPQFSTLVSCLKKNLTHFFQFSAIFLQRL